MRYVIGGTYYTTGTQPSGTGTVRCAVTLVRLLDKAERDSKPHADCVVRTAGRRGIRLYTTLASLSPIR